MILEPISKLKCETVLFLLESHSVNEPRYFERFRTLFEVDVFGLKWLFHPISILR